MQDSVYWLSYAHGGVRDVIHTRLTHVYYNKVFRETFAPYVYVLYLYIDPFDYKRSIYDKF